MDILHRKLTDMGGKHHNGICVAGKKEKKKVLLIFFFKISGTEQAAVNY